MASKNEFTQSYCELQDILFKHNHAYGMLQGQYIRHVPYVSFKVSTYYKNIDEIRFPM